MPWVGEVRMDPATPPLVVITTNEERALPDAFLRRCVVLHLEVNDEPRDKFIAWLVERGRAHAGDSIEPVILEAAARQLASDRAKVRDERGMTPPGQAEYLDLVRALAGLAPGDAARQGELLKRLAPYTFQKHPPERAR